MKLPFLLIFCLSTLSVAVVTVAAEREVATPLWDMIPVIAQAKSLVQLAFGDKDGAAETQKHFLDEGLVTSQLRSAYHLLTGDPETAGNIQGKFFSNLEGVVDALPIVGHLKGGIHLLAGDDEHGWSALKSATSTAGTIVGGVVAGPIGAVGSHLLTDAVITLTDAIAAKPNETRFHGTMDYIDRIGRAKPGEHFDAIAGLVADFGAGVPMGKVAAKANRPRGVHGQVRKGAQGYAEISEHEPPRYASGNEQDYAPALVGSQHGSSGPLTSRNTYMATPFGTRVYGTKYRPSEKMTPILEEPYLEAINTAKMPGE